MANKEGSKYIQKHLLYAFLFIAGNYFLWLGLEKAKGFLAPLLMAAVLALLMFPFANKLQGWGIKKLLATSFSVLLLLCVSIGLFLVVSFQVKDFVDDWDEIKASVKPHVETLQQYILEHTPLEQGDLENYHPAFGEEEKSDGSKGNEETEEQGKQALSVVAGVFDFLTDFLITFVYIFFFIHFRSRFKKFILMLFEDSKQGEVRDIISKSTAVVQSYLFGRLILMVVLAVLYATGLSISGVDRVLFVSVISAVLSIIPFVGNFIGYGIAMVMGVISGGSALTLIGVTLTYAVVQFIETYILQPIILGGKLDIHPFFIILAVILGNAVWGVTGMILSLPLFAIVTIICCNVPALKPLGYLFSSDKKGK
ncbi:AI-2E family transporter [Negadavirga shengliensis]|uniref:AI-2E family transporter n=1 Tax=Negadavirga shengliensis TaxID=1389218 RepID=A0ABV9SZM1_9BACT